jgi:hypothetical protein
VPAIKPGTNTSATPRPAPPMVLRSFCSMAGPMTFTALSMSPRCWRRRATA